MDYFIQCGDSWPQCLVMDDFCIYMFAMHSEYIVSVAIILVRQNYFGGNLYSMMGQSEVDML